MLNITSKFLIVATFLFGRTGGSGQKHVLLLFALNRISQSLINYRHQTQVRMHNSFHAVTMLFLICAFTFTRIG